MRHQREFQAWMDTPQIEWIARLPLLAITRQVQIQKHPVLKIPGLRSMHRVCLRPQAPARRLQRRDRKKISVIQTTSLRHRPQQASRPKRSSSIRSQGNRSNMHELKVQVRRHQEPTNHQKLPRIMRGISLCDPRNQRPFLLASVRFAALDRLLQLVILPARLHLPRQPNHRHVPASYHARRFSSRALRQFRQPRHIHRSQPLMWTR